MARGEAAYVQVERSIWAKRRFRSVSDNARYLFLYIVTCPHATQSGLFRLPPGYACEDLQWSMDKYRKAMDELIGAGLIKYDEEHHIVFDSHQIEKFPPQNGNQVQGIIGKLKELPNTHLFKDLANVAGTLERPYIQALVKWLDNRLSNSFETVTQTVSKGYGNPGPRPKPEPKSEPEPEILLARSGDEHPSDLEPEPEKPVITIPIIGKGAKEFSVYQPMIDEWRNLFPKVDIDQELRAIRAWNLARPGKRKTRSGVLRHITAWLTKSQNQGGSNGGAGPGNNRSPTAATGKAKSDGEPYPVDAVF